MKSLFLGVLCAMVLGSTALAGDWQITEKTSALDGAHSYSAARLSNETVTGLLDEPKHAAILITCDMHGYSLGIFWPDFVEVTDGASPVSWKIDDGPVQTGNWTAGDQIVEQNGRGGIDLTKRWGAGAKLVVRVSDKHGGQETTFDLGGLADIATKVSGMNCG